jgi:hypothetical protein
MALTLADHQVQHDNLYAQGIVKIFEEENPILKYMPMVAINGDGQRVRIEEGMPGVEWRRVNQDYVESTGVIGVRQEPLYILGGEIYADNYILRTQGTGRGTYDHWQTQFEMKSRAISREYSRAAIEGDDLVDPDEMPGWRRRIPSGQVLVAATNGGPLTLPLLDELIDKVVSGNVHIFCNKFIRRKITGLIATAGTGANWVLNYDGVNDSQVGKQILNYNGVPIHVIEDRGNENSILGFDEVCGSSSVTSSLYAINFSESTTYGIYNGDGPPVEVRDLGEDQDSPGKRARVEFFTGMVMKHPRSGARLRGLTAA